MNIKIICVGKLKEKFYREAVDEFMKRLSRYGTFEICEVADEKAPEQLSSAQMEQVKNAEGERILAKAGNSDVIIAMDIKGEQLSSPQMANRIKQYLDSGKSRLCFIIGGSLGLSDEVLRKANLRLSFGAPTFSHQIFRIMLLEQVYRCFRINNNEPYHK